MKMQIKRRINYHIITDNNINIIKKMKIFENFRSQKKFIFLNLFYKYLNLLFKILLI